MIPFKKVVNPLNFLIKPRETRKNYVPFPTAHIEVKLVSRETTYHCNSHNERKIEIAKRCAYTTEQ